MSRIYAYPGALLAAALAISFFLGLWAVPLFDLDEGAFSEATREMFERGDFISTYLNGAPRFDKPILIYWLQAASAALFGFNEFALRLPSALAACGWVLALYFFLRRVADQRLALHAALITALSLAVSVIAKAATADALLNMLLASSMFAMYLFLRENDRRWLLALYALMGLGFLAKGPVAVLIPGAVGLLYCGWRRQWRAALHMATYVPGMVLFAAIALPWYVLQYQAQGQAFIDGFFLKHNVDRFSGTLEQHGGSVFYYVPVVLVGILPFTSAGLRALAAVKSWRNDDLQMFALLWLAFVLVFFSFSGTKLPHYANYGLTGLFILCATHIDQLRSRWWALLPALLLTLVLLLLPEWLARHTPAVRDPFIQDALADAGAALGTAYRLYFAALLALLIYFLFERRLQLPIKLLATAALLIVGLSTQVLPAMGQLLQAPVKEAALLTRQQQLQVSMWRITTPSFSFYRQAVTPKIDTPAAGEVVLTKKAQLPELPPHEVIYARGGVALVRLR